MPRAQDSRRAACIALGRIPDATRGTPLVAMLYPRPCGCLLHLWSRTLRHSWRLHGLATLNVEVKY